MRQGLQSTQRSKLANEEHPDINVSIRGAISIARRLQDPMAELVKIEPKSIGVGQYQHDVNEKRLTEVLDGVVEDSANQNWCRCKYSIIFPTRACCRYIFQSCQEYSCL